jgi:general secretion pathway protein D
VPVSTVSSLVSGVGTLATGQLNANIEYKDVAIELKVTPRINPDGYVRMEIEQKVNDLGRNVTISGTTVPEINKREAKSSVAVQDQSTIVLGGLIKETKTITETKVPILGDIPLLGHLFKSKANGKMRDELIVFIRPTVMRTDAQAVAEARRRARMLKAGEELELEKRFESAVPGAPSSALTIAPSSAAAEPPAPIEQAQEPTSETTPATEETDRYTAKIKALQEQAPSPSN